MSRRTLLHGVSKSVSKYLAQFFESKIFQTKVIEKIETHFLFLKIVSFANKVKNMVQPDRPQMTTENGACALHAV